MKSGLLSREGKIIEKKSYPMTDTFEELLACMKDFHQIFKDDFIERLMEEYNIIREKMGMDIITPNLKCCTYCQDANLLGALANYIGRNE